MVIPFLSGGGAERVMSILLDNLSREKFQIHLALIANRRRPLERIPEDITIHVWNHRRVSRGILHLPLLMHKIQPDLVFSTLGYVNLAIMMLRPFFPRKTRFIARESNIPSLHLTQFRCPAFMKFLYHRLYPRFDLIICQSRDMQNDLVSAFDIPWKLTTIINNPVDLQMIEGAGASEKHLPLPGPVKLLAVGKLMRQKGFDLLLRAVALLESKRYSLTIIGDGPERDRLLALSRELEIAGRVEFTGYRPNPYPAMQDADLFILSSRYEGFPNVVLEANACGTPVIAFDCPGGLSEIIEAGVNGWLVERENVERLADAIAAAAKKPLNRKWIREYIQRRYGIEKIISQYERALGSL